MTKRLLILFGFVACLLVSKLAAAQSTTRLWFPSHPTGMASSSFPTPETMVCSAWVPTEGITNAQNAVYYLTGGLGGGGLCSLTIYDATGATEIATFGPNDCSATGAVTGAAGVFSLTAGTKYQVCLCGNASGTYLGADPGPGVAIQLYQNAITAAPLVTNAANPCVAAVAPATTGVLTAVNANAIIGLLETTTP